MIFGVFAEAENLQGCLRYFIAVSDRVVSSPLSPFTMCWNQTLVIFSNGGHLDFLGSTQS